ncbi:MAG: hypothetical protein K8T89_07890, partial [Planctomycetes bacterium]|nr:hypothetical protein [Planctomycetota bacterium]
MFTVSPCFTCRTAPIVLGIIFFAIGDVHAQVPALPAAWVRENKDDPKPAETTPLPKLTIGQCLQIAFERQPKLTAMRASLGSAQMGQRGIESARIFGQLSGDFKYRKQQAANGV